MAEWFWMQKKKHSSFFFFFYQGKAVPKQSNAAQRDDNVPLEETSSNRIGFSSSFPIKTVIAVVRPTALSPAHVARQLDERAISNLDLRL